MEELQLTIRCTEGGLLGHAEEVRAALDGHFPAIAWEWTSTGADIASGPRNRNSVERADQQWEAYLCCCEFASESLRFAC